MNHHTPLRAAVVGARRERQGTGEFVARELAALGCEVRGIVGTRPETLAAARDALRSRHGIDARGYLDLGELLDAEAPQIVAICSPPETHLELLEQALAAGCHVYCEKPLVYGADADAQRARACAAIDAAADAGLQLGVNAQWPFTLPAFDALYPGARTAPRELRMWLAPDSTGAQMVVDSASHVLSMAHALVGPGAVEAARFAGGADAEAGELSFTYRHAAGELEARLELRRSAAVPRPAGYAIDGHALERRITQPGYRISFVRPDGVASDPADPLVAAVEDFVRGVRTQRPLDRSALELGVGGFFELVAAARHQEVSYG